ncbi:MAG: cold shock domain-containing protein [Lachnospiraceae bacterium]
MYGRVTKYFTDRGYGFIRGEDNNSYFIHHSQLKGEHIERGYYVSFKPYKTDRSDFNAGDIAVIELPDIQSNSTVKKKSKQHISSKHKSCNADKIIRPDKQFKKFIKKFMEEKENTYVSK